MAKEFKPVVVTANDLIEGDSVFLGAFGWVRDIRLARVAMVQDEAKVLERIAEAGSAVGLEKLGAMPSPITGKKSGNREFFMVWRTRGDSAEI